MRDKLIYFGLIVLFSVIIAAAAMYNGFPLVTSDSGAYIYEAFHLEAISKGRPIFYSVFLVLSSLKTTLWLVIFFQSLILAFLIDRVMSIFFAFNIPLKIISVAVSVLFTSLSWYTSQIMPDIFTAVLFLSSVLYLYSKDRIEKLLLAFLIILSAIVHNSNLITSLVFFGSLLVICSFTRELRYHLKNLLTLIMFSAMSWLIVASTNFIAGFGFAVNKTSHVFLMGRLVENGILKEYLDEKCSDKNYQLCAYKDNLPAHAWDFIWSNDGAFVKTGGWEHSEAEYTEIINATVLEPKYLLMNIRESIKATMQQVVLTDVGDGIWPYLDGTNPYWKIQELFPGEFNTYLNSRQNKDKLRFKTLNSIFVAFICLTFLFSMYLLIKNKNKKLNFLLYSALLFIVFNAFATATFGNVLARLNSRLIWILPFICVCIILSFIAKEKKAIV